MNELDYAILAVLLVSIVIGATRGAVREIFNLLGWGLALLLAHTFAQDMAAWYADWATDAVVRLVLAWVTIFLGVLVLIGVLASLASGLVRKLGLSMLDRSLGLCFGLLRGGMMLVALTLVLGLTRWPQSAVWQQSRLTPWLVQAALPARALLPEAIAAKIRFSAVPAPSVQRPSMRRESTGA